MRVPALLNGLRSSSGLYSGTRKRRNRSVAFPAEAFLPARVPAWTPDSEKKLFTDRKKSSFSTLLSDRPLSNENEKETELVSPAFLLVTVPLLFVSPRTSLKLLPCAVLNLSVPDDWTHSQKVQNRTRTTTTFVFPAIVAIVVCCSEAFVLVGKRAFGEPGHTARRFTFKPPCAPVWCNCARSKSHVKTVRCEIIWQRKCVSKRK